MRRAELQRIIYEVGCRFEQDRFYIVGSAAILAVLPDPPEGALTATRDVDVIPRGDEEAIADRISYVLGEASDFDIEHGYYAEGVTSETPTFAPNGWKRRAIPVQVDVFTALCMEPHDLLISKLGAGREKDLEFARAAVAMDLVDRRELESRLNEVAWDGDSLRTLVEKRIAGLFD